VLVGSATVLTLCGRAGARDGIGGERKRLPLANALKSSGNVQLLDELTNRLKVMTIRALEDLLVGCLVCGADSTRPVVLVR
jgi:ABC-type iron transport system FetAB ATPase subunit